MITAGQIAVAMGLQLDSASFKAGNGALRRIAASARRYIEGEAVASVYRFLRSTTEAATQLVTLSQSMGLTVEQTQMWGYVAQQSGSNVKVLNEGLNMFIRNLKNLTLGKGSAMIKEQFASLGIDATKAKQALSGPDGLNEVLLEVADRVQAMGRTGNTAALTRLFGRDAGRALLGSFARGRAGIESVMQRRRGMGLISEQDAKNSQELDNRIKDIKTALSALAAVVVAKLAPSLIKMAESASKWIADNKDLISGALVLAVKFLAMAFRDVARALEVVAFFARHLWLTIPILTAIGYLIYVWMLPALQAAAIAFVFVSAAALQFAINTAASVIESVQMIAATLAFMAEEAIAAGIDMLVAFAPFIALGVAIAAIIAAIIYGVVLIVKNWAKVKEAFVKTWHEAVEAGREFLDWIESLPGVVWDAMKDAAHFIVSELGKALDWVLAKAHAVWDDMKQIPILGYAFRGIGTVAGDIFGSGGTSGQAAIRRMNAADVARASGNAHRVTVGDTTQNITVNVKNAEDAKKVTDAYQDQHNKNLRHTMAGVGGQVR